MAQKQATWPNVGFFIIDYSTGGGVERVTADLVQGFLHKGFKDIHLVSLKAANEKPAMAYPEDISLKILNASPKNFSNELALYLKENQIQHLIFQGDNLTINFEVLKAARIAGCSAYPQYHGSPYAYLKKYPDAQSSNFQKRLFASLQFPFKKIKLKNFIASSEKGVFCVSQGSADELKEIFKRDKALHSKIKVIHNPFVLPGQLTAQKENIVSFASRLEKRHKNAFLIVKAWELVANKLPDWKLVIMGSGSLEMEMKKYCASRNIDNIEFKGFVKDVNKEFAKSSISVSTSNCEGFSMSVAEAILQGNAIAATSSDGGISDMLKNGKTAVLVPKNDAEKLGNAILELARDSALRSRLSQEALNIVKGLSEGDCVNLWIEELNR